MPEDNQAPAPSEPVVTDTAPQTTEVITPSQPVAPQPAVNGKRFNKKKLTLLGLIAAVLVVVLGAGAGAYFGVIAPNKPENVLKEATKKFLLDRPNTATGTVSIDMKQEEAELKNVTVKFTSTEDRAKKTFNINLEAAASGVKLPLELRGVDQNIYFKVGDLGTIKSVAALSGSPEASALVDTISQKVSNQWIEVDQSLLKQAKMTCVTDSITSSFTQEDVDQLMKLYSENSFINIKSKTNDTVDGVNMTKFDLGFDETKAEAFAAKLDSVESLKKAKECSESASNSTTGDTEVKDDTPKPNLNFAVWVDSGKNIKKMELKVSDDEADGVFTANWSNGTVNITKPDGAKPLMEVLGDFSTLFSGGLGGTMPTGTDTLGSGADADISDACLRAYQTSIASGSGAIPAECQ